MSVITLAYQKVGRPLTRAALGAGLALIGFGGGVAGAAPVLVDDPIPVPAPIVASAPVAVPAPAAANPAGGTAVANAFLQVLNSLLNSVVPGAGSIMPTDASALTSGGYPGSTLPGQTTTLPGTTGTTTLPGQTTTLPGTTGTTLPGTTTTLPGTAGTTTLPGQTTTLPGTTTTLPGTAGTTATTTPSGTTSPALPAATSPEVIG